MYKLPERRGGGGRGGEVIWAMPERKHSFLNEVFPYMIHSLHSQRVHMAPDLLTLLLFESLISQTDI